MAIYDGSFKSKAVHDFFYYGKIKKLPIENTAKLQCILDFINTIDKLPPSLLLFRAHEHKGKGAGTWSFDITGNMRVLCEFDEDMDAINIRIIDPH